MNYKKYEVKKDKCDMQSSLKSLSKSTLKKVIEENGVDDVKELAEYIIDDFEQILDMTKDDPFTRMYFERLIEHENSEYMFAYEQDIESHYVFIYKNNEHYSYYIPTEIKKIIKKILKI